MRQALIIIFIFFSFHSVIAQGTNTYFGRNSIQYRQFNWSFISTVNFDAYYYDEQKELAHYCLKAAEQHLKDIEQKVDYRMGGRSQILIFSSFDALRQSNLFLKDIPFNPGGFTYATGNKIIVVSDGNPLHLERQLRYGIAEMLVQELLYGGSFQERIQSSTLLYLPEWYYKGLLSYLANPWSTEIDSKVKDAFALKKFHRFNLLEKQEAILAGHSFWYYIDEVYGKKTIADLLYLTRVSKGYENALSFILGIKTKNVFADWIRYYENRFANAGGNEPLKTAIALPDKIKDHEVVNAKMNSNGKQVLLSTFNDGISYIWIFSLTDQKLQSVVKEGNTNRFLSSETYMPVVFWKNDGKSFFVLLFKKGKLLLNNYNTAGKKLSSSEITGLESVQFGDYHPTEDKILLSAVKNGRSDLFLYFPKSETLQQLTNDQYADMWARFAEGGKSVIFSSNRNTEEVFPVFDTISPLSSDANFDVYLIEIPPATNKIKRITNTPYINEIMPIEYSESYLGYLSDNSGIYNFYVSKQVTEFDRSRIIVPGMDTLVYETPLNVDDLYADTTHIEGLKQLLDTSENVWGTNKFKDVVYHYPLTDFSRNLLQVDISANGDMELEIMKYLGKYYIMTFDVSENIAEDAGFIDVQPTRYRKETGHQIYYMDTSFNSFLVQKRDSMQNFSDSVAKDFESDTLKADYYFQTGFPELPSMLKKEEKKTDEEIFNYRSPEQYRLTFFPDYLATQLIDNSIINTYYHINNDYAHLFNSSAHLSARLETGMSDLFNNHTIRAGGRLPLSLYGTDVFVDYTNRKRRVDFGARVFRQSRLAEDANSLRRIYLIEFRPFVSFPFTENLALRGEIFERYDKQLAAATDAGTLGIPDIVNYWTGAKIEIIFDNSLLEDLNFRTGLRYKVFLEYYQNTSQASRSTGIAGLDIRHYKKIHKKILWANRLAYNHSFGPSRVLYMVGGVENQIGASRDNLEASTNTNYSFQLMANGIRGFRQNVRNGENYLVWNSEVRLPLFTYLSKRPVRTDFFRNIQWAVFADAGSAWNGTNPYSPQHYNSVINNQGSVEIKINYKNNPFVGGFGTGIRSRLFGYYFRLDCAWGIRNGIIQDNAWFFALGYDF